MSAVTKLRWKASDLKPDPFPFENAPIGVAQLLSDGCLGALNPQLEQRMALACRPKMVLRFSELTRPESEGERLVRELFNGERDSFQIDSMLTGEDGSPTLWTAWRVSATDGEPGYAIAYIQTIPENRQADERRRHTEKLEVLGRLAGGVVHDFNNLLTGVLLYSDLLMATLEPGASARQYAEEIRKAGVQATGLVKQLLAVARPTKLEPRLLSLNEMAEGVRNLLLRLIGENIELKFNLDPNLGLVKMDLTQAQQVLLNLVLNARDAMPSGGQISVSTSNCRVQILGKGNGEPRRGSPKNEPRAQEPDGLALPYALFVVRDNGPGMDAATRAHLFEAFFTTKSGGKGTGLGLATVYDLVTGSGGLIHVDSMPGCGTRFSVLLPLVPAAALRSITIGPKTIGIRETGTREIEGEFQQSTKTGVQP